MIVPPASAEELLERWFELPESSFNDRRATVTSHGGDTTWLLELEIDDEYADDVVDYVVGYVQGAEGAFLVLGESTDRARLAQAIDVSLAGAESREVTLGFG